MAAPKSYLLKPAVLARALAELSVLGILSILPVVLFFLGHFASLNFVVKACFCILSPVSVFVIGAIAKIPFRVQICDSGLAARSILKNQSLSWQDMKSLKLANHMGWKQYIISYSAGELSFPYQLNHVSELVESIRSRLPNRGRSTAGDAQLYRLGKVTLLVELLKSCLQAGFVVLFVCFAVSVAGSNKFNQGDAAFVSITAFVFCLGFIWRIFQLFCMPHEIRVELEGLNLKGPFSSSFIPWNQIEKACPAGLIYPEGLLISWKKRKYLLAGCLDSFDELCEEISNRIAKESK